MTAKHLQFATELPFGGRTVGLDRLNKGKANDLRYTDGKIHPVTIIKAGKNETDKNRL